MSDQAEQATAIKISKAADADDSVDAAIQKHVSGSVEVTEQEKKEMFYIDCPICMSEMYKPYTLPCGHSFCRYCIVYSINLTCADSSMHSSRSLCPTCRAPLRVAASHFKTNIALWDLIKYVNGKGPDFEDSRHDEKFKLEEAKLIARERGGSQHPVAEENGEQASSTVLEAFIENEQLSDNRSLVRVVRNNVVDGMEHHQWSLAFLEFPRRVTMGDDLHFRVACIVMEEDEVAAGGRPILLRGDDEELIDDTYHDESLRACIVQNNEGEGESSVHLMTTTSIVQNGRAAFTFTGIPTHDDAGQPIDNYMVYIYQTGPGGEASVEGHHHPCEVDSHYLFMKMTFDIGAQGGGDSLSDGEVDGSDASDSLDDDEGDMDDDGMDDFVVDDDEVEYETGASQESGSSGSEAEDTAEDSAGAVEGMSHSTARAANDRPAKRQKRVFVIEDDDDDDY
jgi:hypothetical protein